MWPQVFRRITLFITIDDEGFFCFRELQNLQKTWSKELEIYLPILWWEELSWWIAENSIFVILVSPNFLQLYKIAKNPDLFSDSLYKTGEWNDIF